MTQQLIELRDALLPAAIEAGNAILQIYKKNPQATLKNDGSPVTEADEAAEAIILPALKKLAPEITVISEENAESHALAAPDRFFLVDPLDGTKEFLKRDGKGSFTVNIALVENRSPVMGIVHAPALNRTFSGIVGEGAHENGKTVETRSSTPKTRIAVASASHRDDETNAWLNDKNIKKTVSIGSSLKFCLLACGEADVYPRFGPTMEWDTAAGDAVLRSAGGMVENPDQSPFIYGKADYRNTPFIAHSGCLV